MSDLGQDLLEMARTEGACAAGIATVETLAGGPPSADLSCVLPSARSAVSFAVALEPGPIDAWFAKTDHEAHWKDNLQAATASSSATRTGRSAGAATSS